MKTKKTLINFKLDLQQPTEIPAASMKICSGIENRTPYTAFLDWGGPNRQDPSITDPAALIISVGGHHLKIPVSDLAKAVIRV